MLLLHGLNAEKQPHKGDFWGAIGWQLLGRSAAPQRWRHNHRGLDNRRNVAGTIWPVQGKGVCAMFTEHGTHPFCRLPTVMRCYWLSRTYCLNCSSRRLNSLAHSPGLPGSWRRAASGTAPPGRRASASGLHPDCTVPGWWRFEFLLRRRRHSEEYSFFLNGHLTIGGEALIPDASLPPRRREIFELPIACGISGVGLQTRKRAASEGVFSNLLISSTAR